MAFYTSLTDSDMQALMANYDLGDVVSFQGISGGVENTNYFVNTTHGKYVLTLFEEFDYDEVPYFLNVVAHFQQAGFHVPAALLDNKGERLQRVKNKPAILVDCFAGEQLHSTNVQHCKLMGEQLALLHLAGQNFPEQRASHRGLDWWHNTSQQLASQLPKEDAALLDEIITHFDTFLASNIELPMGTVHGDLFYNNTLFDGDHLCAIIDFYNACHSWLLYDLAIAINDWCTDAETGALEMEKYHAFMSAYSEQRSLTQAEQQIWPMMLEVAAMRFWLSRLEAWHGAMHDPERLALQHDPDVFKRIVLARRADTHEKLALSNE